MKSYYTENVIWPELFDVAGCYCLWINDFAVLNACVCGPGSVVGI